MSRPAKPPEVPPTDEERAPLRIVGQNPVGPPDLAQRMIAAGVQPSPLPDPLPEGLVIVDDPYPHSERPCTYDPADEEPEAEPVATHPPNPACSCANCWVALGGPGTLDRSDDWTPPRPAAAEYTDEDVGTLRVTWSGPWVWPGEDVVRTVALPPPGTRWCIHCGATFTKDVDHDAVCEEPGTKEAINGLFDFPAVAPQGGPDPRNDVRGLSKATWDPTWMDEMPVFRMGTKDRPGGFMTYGEMRKQDLDQDHDGDHVPSLLTPDPLRSYLRTLTNPDATPQDVVDALDALTPEDRALVVDGVQPAATFTRAEPVERQPGERVPEPRGAKVCECGSTEVTWQEDPYALDVHNASVWSYLCEPCADNKAMDI